MFTGLIEEKAQVISNEPASGGRQLCLHSPFKALQSGESIAVNGVCLTYKSEDASGLIFDVSPETLAKTTLSELKAGDLVNLERAMLAHTRFGGHYVSGHVDTTACLAGMKSVGDYYEIEVNDFGADARLYLLPKGSITLDGVSLTINAVTPDAIHLMLVPHTLKVTTLGDLKPGHRFNVEFDYLTRIVAHQLSISGQLKNEVYS
ncbi:riboflavin synthase alpha chain [Legionella rubrilucens]|uniref:Riboflavin synthase n=1 Tax=Legionella rubrilucens TaxID=458 RepID=A0A0W0Y212_9GAMM|nr:riboflavin synthase [Legionella rubrilucens]KTD50579.1 riboflavin synthase alpha chain [Legionella rubrilucens]